LTEVRPGICLALRYICDKSHFGSIITQIMIYLQGLDLGQNAIRYLDARLLAGLPSLRRLDISQNLLSELQGSPFSPAPLLEHLNLSGNSLQAMPSAVLSPLRALYEMDVGYNKLMSLPSNPGRAFDQYKFTSCIL
jgi:Leucine-rich repeat (LRR) protein